MERFRLHWQTKPYTDWRVIVSVLFIVLLVAARSYVWAICSQDNQQTAVHQFNTAVQDHMNDLAQQFEVYADTLYSGRALLLTNAAISREQWTDFVNAQNIPQRYPGVYGISYATAISRGQAAALTAQLNADRLPTETKPVTIYPATSDQQLIVLTYVAPASAPQVAIGYDLFSSAERAAMLRAARDSGQPTASVPLPLMSVQPLLAPKFVTLILLFVSPKVAAFV
ncbi:MAG TPA: CHASE domain-containing protein [Candidatus Saccharimonadales bacterium]|nr:CHASE domain-containing protein [Candidatus Saccharimonadales bacterium]